MFSDNDKVSARQIKYLLILEWTAKLCLLLPIVLSGRSAGSMIFCIMLGAAAWSGLIWIAVRWLDPERSFFDQLCAAAGKPAAALVLAAGLLYFLVQAAVFTNLCAEVTALYLLPEVSVPLLCVLPIAAGVYLAYGSVEIRGRFCEVVGPVVLGLIILLVIAAAFGCLSTAAQESTLVSVKDRLARGGFEVFACMGGMFVPLYSGHFVNGRQKSRAKRNKNPDSGIGKGSNRKENNVCGDSYKAVRKAGLISVAIAGSLCALAALSYGRNGMQAMDFPTIRVMSNIRIPGAFWQRWDIPFLALLIVSMTVNIAGAMWYVREILAVFQAERRVYISWLAAAVLVYFAAAGFLNAFTAVCYYRAMNMQILIPLIFFFYIIMGIHRKVKKTEKERDFCGKEKRAQRAALFGRSRRMAGRTGKYSAGKVSGMLALAVIVLAAVFLITGCSARDPEERLYPLALEIGMQDGQLTVTYAWSEGLGPAMAEQESESSSTGTSKENDMGIESESKAQANKSRNMHTDTDQISSSKNLTTLKGDSLAEIQKLETEFSERQLDYSHVKAIILRDNLQSFPQIEREVMNWLAGDTALATGLLVYRSGDSTPGLQEAEEHSSGQVGTYLENLYKNSETYRAMATTLGEVIAEYFA